MSKNNDMQCLLIPDSMWEWGWTIEWLGWRRMLWLAIQLDFHTKQAGFVFFGLLVSYGLRLKPFKFQNCPYKESR